MISERLSISLFSFCEGQGLQPIKAPRGAFIQFACAASATAGDGLFTEQLLRNITTRNVGIAEILRRVASEVAERSGGTQQPFSSDGVSHLGRIYLNQVRSSRFTIGNELLASRRMTVSDRRGKHTDAHKVILSRAWLEYGDLQAIHVRVPFKSVSQNRAFLTSSISNNSTHTLSF